MTCPEAIQAYLDAANLEGEGDSMVQANNAIVVDYIGRLADGTIFDTSVASVAQNCGVYNPNRDYTAGLAFVAGAGQMIPGFDEAVIGMKVNQTKTVTLSPEKAYGQPIADRIMTFPKTDFANTEGFTQGARIYAADGSSALITNMTDEEVTLDFNSELAGKELTFDITIKSIN
jgi:FKBP-type peptidyl-prolyl cis-trans isomerase 2